MIFPTRADPTYWIIPVGSDKEWSAEQVVESYVGREQIYAFRDTTHTRIHVKKGDWVCFYVAGRGTVAHAKVSSVPEKKTNSLIRNPETYPWVFNLESVDLYLNKPIVIDTALRETLDAFKDKDLKKMWGWFVQRIHKISKHDFDVLTRSHIES